MAVVLVLPIGVVGCTADVGMDADFGFKVDCPQQPADEMVIAVERQMYAAGFDLLDTTRSARDKNVYLSYALQVDALDKAGQTISILSLGDAGALRPEGSPFVIHVALYSRPRTQRDAALEQAITSWMTKDLGCSARDFARHENGLAAMPTYKSVVANLKNLFVEARQMGAKPDALLMH